MANDKKFVVKNGLQSQNVDFVSPDGSKTIQVTMLDSDTLSVSGGSGQLFSITDSLTGTIFAVNDISGVPSIEVDDDGEIRLAETFGNVGVGVSGPTEKLHVAGNVRISGTIKDSSNSAGTPGYVLSTTGTGLAWVIPQSGYTGSQGVIGYTGSQGAIGFTGSQGIQGFTGSQGAIGFTGSQGIQGIQGVTGFTGSQGVQGVIGYTGSQGIQGIQGVIGFTGSQGNTGFTGSQGIQGVIGFTGSRGATGFTGSQGVGFTGSQGIPGYTGSQGALSSWVIKTANYTAIANDRIITNSSGGTFTISLPASPSVGTYIQITDGWDLSTTPVTVARNGSTIEGLSDDVLLDIQGVTYEFIYANSTWQVTATAGAQGPIGYTGSAGTAGPIGYTGSASVDGLTPETISTNTLAVNSKLYILTATLTLTLPSSPTTGNRIGILNLTNDVLSVVARNGSNIMGVAEDLTIDVLKASFELYYIDSTTGWAIL